MTSIESPGCTIYIYAYIYIAYRERGSPVAVIILVTGQEACNYIILFAAQHSRGHTHIAIPFHLSVYFCTQMKLTQHWPEAQTTLYMYQRKAKRGEQAGGVAQQATQRAARERYQWQQELQLSHRLLLMCSLKYILSMYSSVCVCVWAVCVSVHICLVHFFLLLHSPWQIPSHSYPLWQNAIKLLWCFH